MKYPDNYVNLQRDDNVNDIICYTKDPTQPNWKIVLPESIVVDTVKWFHQVMGHPGEKRLQETMNQRYHHPKLRYHCWNPPKRVHTKCTLTKSGSTGTERKSRDESSHGTPYLLLTGPGSYV